MRQLGTVADQQAAERLANYLLTKGIAVSVDPASGGWTVWVRNEDHLDEARREFANFTADPEADVYRQAQQEAGELRAADARRVRQANKNLVDVGQRLRRGHAGSRAPITLLLMTACIAVAVFSKLGQDAAFVTHLEIDYLVRTPNGPRLAEAWREQPWRLITPIFLHFGLPHIFFNGIMLLQLGTIVELLRGSWKLTILVVLIGLTSNFAQYLLSGPYFGGMSGVIYGLFGYAWMKSRYEPGSGFYITTNTVIWMVGWFVLCLTGALGPVANTAHGAGLIVGMILGRAPSLLASMR